MNLTEIRNMVFTEFGKSKFKRIMVCAFFIAVVWCFADLLSGNLENVWWHNVVCLAFGVVLEAIIPWGKQTELKNEQEVMIKKM